MLGLRPRQGASLLAVFTWLALAGACGEETPKKSTSEDAAKNDAAAGEVEEDDDDDAPQDAGAVPRRDGGADGGTPRLDAAARDGAVDAGQRDTSTSDGASNDAGGDQRDAATGDASASGCGAKMLPVPENMKERGPWHVGVRTAKVGRLNVEVMYPAKPGSTAGKEPATYDIRAFLPERERNKVPADHSPAVQPIGGHLYRDVPLDEEHGPYPVVIFIHGTASFRIASGTTNVHWASRGFVVLAADYPGLGLSDQLSATLECGLPQSGGQDIPGDVKLQLDALKGGSGDLSFLKDRVDLTRLGISGHSQGGCVSATLSTLPNVRIVMPFSGSAATAPSPTLESILYVSGMDDTVIGYSFPLIGNVVCPLGSFTTSAAFDGSPGPPKVRKRVVGITGGGHLVPTDLCQTNMQGKNAIQEASENKVCGVSSAVIIGLPALFDCGKIDWKVGLEALNYATTAALEETLQCRDRSKQFAELKKELPQVGDYREAVK